MKVQPNDHHRARYESEGSRGAVKDQSGESSPKIKVTNGNVLKCSNFFYKMTSNFQNDKLVK